MLNGDGLGVGEGLATIDADGLAAMLGEGSGDGLGSLDGAPTSVADAAGDSSVTVEAGDAEDEGAPEAPTHPAAIIDTTTNPVRGR